MQHWRDSREGGIESRSQLVEAALSEGEIGRYSARGKADADAAGITGCQPSGFLDDKVWWAE